MNKADSVCVVIDDVNKGDVVQVNDVQLTAQSEIPVPHKMALKDIEINEIVFKYGLPIGYAITPIKKGELVHVDNLGSDKVSEGEGAH